ncbi:MAG: hypothetical protein IPJ85_14730 [Flavobacteriales bacterium]|nr:hypothetical protein [Flavobacteriales bacterium]
MARFIIRCFAFVAFAAIFSAALLILWGELMPRKLRPNLPHPVQLYGFLDTRLKEADASSPVDVLFLGSSKAYRGFDTRIWASQGISSFNLGSTGQTPMQSELLLARYLHRLQPRLVVIEVDPVPFMDEGVESSLDFLANGPIDREAWRMATRINHLKTWNALVFGAWQQFTGRRNPLPKPQRQGPNSYVPGGFTQHDPENYQPAGYLPPMQCDPRPEQLQAFLRAVRMLDEESTPFVLVTAPVTDAFARSWIDDERLWSLLAPGHVHFRMQDAAMYSDSLHFYDRGHLNQNGVELFNRALIDSLGSRGLLRPFGDRNQAPS